MDGSQKCFPVWSFLNDRGQNLFCNASFPALFGPGENFGYYYYVFLFYIPNTFLKGSFLENQKLHSITRSFEPIGFSDLKSHFQYYGSGDRDTCQTRLKTISKAPSIINPVILYLEFKKRYAAEQNVRMI